MRSINYVISTLRFRWYQRWLYLKGMYCRWYDTNTDWSGISRLVEEGCRFAGPILQDIDLSTGGLLDHYKTQALHRGLTIEVEENRLYVKGGRG